MTNEYHNDIVDILFGCGRKGMKVKNIALNIYNRHYGLFATNVVFSNLYDQVRFYLCRLVSDGHSSIMRIRWGYYALKPDFAIQLDFIEGLYKEEPTGRSSKTKPTDNAIQLQLF